VSIKKLKKFLSEENDKKSSSDEINIRQLISDEYDAIKNYQQFASETEDEEVRKVLLDIADEEKVHSGELEALLLRKGIDDKAFMRKGAREVKKLLKNKEGGSEESSLMVKPMPIIGELPSS
jgi:rubrerythrin